MICWIRRVLFREPSLLEDRANNNKNVCMVVWNTFETDARVTKEATTLIDAGKKVTVVAVHQHNRTKRNELVKGISVIRVDRTLRKLKSNTKHMNSPPNQIQQTNDVTEHFSTKQKLKKKIRSLFRFVPRFIINVRFFKEAFLQNAGIYHSHDLNTLIPVYLASRLRGAKLIYDAHEVSTDRAGWKNKRFWEFIERILIKKADKVITTNLTRAEYFKEHYNIKIPYIIKNVPPYEKVLASNTIREILCIPQEEPIILYQGGLQRDRGLENMIRVVPNVIKGKFVFLGNGKLKYDLLRLVDEVGVKDRVYFIEAVPNEKLLEYTSSATIGLQLLINTCFNHYSACSNKLNEYMMAGLPVVASDLPEIRRTVEEFETGILVNPEDLNEISKAINELLSNKELYLYYKKNTEFAAKENNWENERAKLLEIYEINSKEI